MKQEILKKVSTDSNTIRFRLSTYPGAEPNRFYVSEYGDVYDSLKEKYLAVSIGGRGYRFVHLNAKIVTVHRLVAWEFCPENRDMNLTVDHLDMNRLNNHYTNLEWITLEDNIRRAYIRSGRGYSVDLISQICELYELGKSPIDVYRMIRGTDNTPRGNKADEAFYRMLVSIRNNESHQDIVKNYNFPEEFQNGSRLPGANSLLNKDQILMVAQLYTNGKSYTDIAKILGLDRSQEMFKKCYPIIMRICRRQSWTNITDEVFNNFNQEIVTVRNGGRFTEEQVRRICEMFRDGNKDPKSILANIGIRQIHKDYAKYYDGIMAIVHGKSWTHVSKEYFTPTTFTNKQNYDFIDNDFIFEMFNQGYAVRDVVRMYGLGSKMENTRLYGAIIDRFKKFKRVKDTLEFHLTQDDIESGKMIIWAEQG